MNNDNKTNDSVQQTGLAGVASSGLQEYQPEMWTVRKDDIYAAHAALRDGIEYTRELLAIHDRDLGRDHRSNRIAAEHMEKAIAGMQCALIGLRAAPVDDPNDADERRDPN